MDRPPSELRVAPPVIFGVVLPDLAAYRDLVVRIAGCPFVTMTDLQIAAPIYKGSDAIKEALGGASSALDKFRIYANLALLDDAERLRFARLFAAQYAKRFPASERSDIFQASGEVLKFTFEVAPPGALPGGDAMLRELRDTPHDAAVLAALGARADVDPAHLRAELKVFLDHVYNPRRQELSRVQQAARELGVPRPVVLELVTDGAVPFYLRRLVEPEVQAVRGQLVLLPG